MSRQERPGPAAAGRWRQSDWTRVGLGIWTVAVYVFLFLPIVFIVAYSFNSGNNLRIWKGFGTVWYGRALSNQVITDALGNSIKVALLSSLVAVVLGSLAGVALARRPGRWTAPFLALVLLVLVTPEIVDGIGYLIWFVALGGPFAQGFGPLTSGIIRLVVGHSVFSSAVVALIVRARLQGLDESLEEAAADLGATPARVFRQITLPLMMPAVLAGALLSFTFSLDNTIVSAFVSQAGSTTLPVYIFSQLRNVLKPDIAAISTVMLGITLFALAIVAVVLRRSGESAEDVATTIAGQ